MTKVGHENFNTNKLITINRVKVVIGNVWAFVTNPLIPLAARDNVILFSPTVIPESLEITNDHFFTMGARIDSAQDAVDLFFKKNREIRTVGIFCWDDTWGQAYLKIWKEIAKRNDVKISAIICNNDFTSDFRSDVIRMTTKQVDAVIIASTGDVIIKRMKERNFFPKVLATSNLVEDIKTQKAPKELFEGIYITDWQPNEEFKTKFVKKFGKEPLVEAHNSYETLRSLAKALADNKEDLLAALRKVKYQGVAGEIDFSKSSFVNYATAKLYRVQDGELELVQ